MASVTFPTSLGGTGQTITDDADPNTGLANSGHRTRFIPALSGAVDMAATSVAKAQEAEDFKNLCQQLRDEAETFKNQASTSEGNAATSATLSEEWATKLSTPVDGVEYSSKYYANEASTSATNSANSASAASTSASAASTSEDNAATSASNAATSESNAATSASDASSSANLSEDWATKTSATVDGTSYGSKYYSQQASSSASAASTSEDNAATSALSAADSASAASVSETNSATSASNASTSANVSEDWATSTTEVSGGLKGSKGYAEDAAQSAASLDANDIVHAPGSGLPNEAGTAAAEDAETFVRKNIETIKKTATLDLDFASGDYAVDGGEKFRTTNAQELLTVERATPKWVEGPNGLLREVPINTVAREWRQGKPKGVLIEESRTNLLTYSEQFDNADWVKSGGVTVTANATVSPDGGSTADSIEKTAESYKAMHQAHIASLVPHAGSIFLKAGTLNEVSVAFYENVTSTTLIRSVIDLTTGAVTNDAGEVFTEDYGNGWWRITYSATVTQQDTRFYVYPGNYRETVAGSIFVWGAQLEEASTPSSYIPTTDSPATCAADAVLRTLGSEFNASEGTVFVEIEDRGEQYDELAYLFGFGNQATTSEMFGVKVSSNPPSLFLFGTFYDPAFFTSGVQVKGRLAISFYAKDSKTILAYNGQTEVYAQAIPNLADNVNDLILGQLKVVSAPSMVGVKAASYIPRALTEAELVELTL